MNTNWNIFRKELSPVMDLGAHLPNRLTTWLTQIARNSVNLFTEATSNSLLTSKAVPFKPSQWLINKANRCGDVPTVGRRM